MLTENCNIFDSLSTFPPSSRLSRAKMIVHVVLNLFDQLLQISLRYCEVSQHGAFLLLLSDKINVHLYCNMRTKGRKWEV